jgi:hemerythrin
MTGFVLADEFRILESEHHNLQIMATSFEAFCQNAQASCQCAGCDQRMAAQCAGTLEASLAVLTLFLTTLARHEERLMKQVCSVGEFETLFGAHVEDHANLCAALAGITASSASSRPAATYIKVIGLTRHWLHEHFATFDHVLVELLMLSPAGTMKTAPASVSTWQSTFGSALEVGVIASGMSGRAETHQSLWTSS